MDKISLSAVLFSLLYILVYILAKPQSVTLFVMWIVLPLILSSIGFYFAKYSKNPFVTRLLNVVPLLVNILFIYVLY